MSLPAPQIARLRRRAFRLEYATMTWMVAEAAIAITAGVLTASIALIGFGLDSVIELFSAAIVIWQLRGEIAGQDRQTRAIRLIGVTFFALAAYLAAQSIRDLAAAARPGQSVPGLAVTAAALLAVALSTGLGWWWADPAGALVIAVLAAREGIESWQAASVPRVASRRWPGSPRPSAPPPLPDAAGHGSPP